MGFLMRIECLFVYRVIPLIVLLLGVDIVYCRMPYSDDQSIYPSYYGNLEDSIKSALQKLEHAPKWASDWVPESATNLGQVSGVALNKDGNLLVFHRASNVWDQTTFNMKNVYQSIGEPPIPQPTIYIYNDTGNLIDVWGKNLFYIPHGITVDHDGNVWLTDVALHQVFKFTPDNREKPAMVLGEKFVPGSDDTHFCKPSAVAVLASGEFFVADGYCNTRIIKYSANGTRLITWGRPNVRQQVPGYQPKQSPYSFNLPHALALAEERGLVCVADRENGRVGCFRTDDGTHVASYHSWMFGGTVYSVAYSPVQGGRLYVVNGMTAARVRGYVLELESGRLRATFAPEGDFTAPHDLVVSPDGSRVYVAEINPYRVTKFTDESLALVAGNSTSPVRRVAAAVPAPVKPTTTIEASGASWSWEWWRVCGLGAGGALAAAAAAAALCAARRRLAAPPGAHTAADSTRHPLIAH